MVQILPFRGLRYQLAKVGQLEDVVAPPYDVIDTTQQQALYDRHPANVVRLILNQKTAEDAPGNTVYTRAAWYLQDWLKTGVLALDGKPALYAYSQTWQPPADADPIERKGLIALLKLEDLTNGRVLPHEYTLGGPKEDRFRLMQATLANLSQIFMVYEDPDRQVETRLFPQLSADGWQQATDEHGVSHRIQSVSDDLWIAQVQQLFSEQSLLIADGHHRYETALRFRQAVRDRLGGHLTMLPDGSLPSDYIMVYLSNLNDPGLQVYPTHRVLMRWPMPQTEFEACLLKLFEPVDNDEEPIAFYYETATQTMPLRLKPGVDLSGLPVQMRHLDVALLDHLVFEGMLKQSANALKDAGVLRFYREEDALQKLLADHAAVAAFRMGTPLVHDIKQVCQAGYRMPQKSTYFYPKVLSGLVLYPYYAPDPGTGFALDYLPNAQPLPQGLFDETRPTSEPVLTQGKSL